MLIFVQTPVPVVVVDDVVEVVDVDNTVSSSLLMLMFVQTLVPVVVVDDVVDDNTVASSLLMLIFVQTPDPECESEHDIRRRTQVPLPQQSECSQVSGATGDKHNT